MAIVSVALDSAPLHAQEAGACASTLADTLPCPIGTPVQWREGVEKSVLLDGSGGSIMDSSNQVQIDFAAGQEHAPVAIAYTTMQTPTLALEADAIGLGTFRLSAPEENVGASQSDLPAWQMQFTYPDCASMDACTGDVFDETSVQCLHLDRSESRWVALESTVNVLTNRLACSSTALGEYAMVAKRLQTSGVGGTWYFLPLVGGL